MRLLYDLSILSFSVLTRIASLFNSKARQFVTGRNELIERIESTLPQTNGTRIWMHCASLGEFEQGRPVLEALRKEFRDVKLVVTFFSPSGYEIRKNYPGADYIFYLPADTREHAERFVHAVNPALAIFVKYEFWYHYSDVLKRKNIPLISISTIFRPSQVFFKPYGGFHRKILRNFSWFFVQNDRSTRLLSSIGITNHSQTGDTRFDRVSQIVKNASAIEVAARFKGRNTAMVVGSCWQEDFDVLLPLINGKRLKFIIAPHEISESFISSMEKVMTVKSIRFSAASDQPLDDYIVLIIDNIGMLSSLYRYGEFAFVGGAFGKGLHNILEAACYGIPVFFGNRRYEKFQEAVDLIQSGGAFAVSDADDLREKYETVNQPENFQRACTVSRSYVEQNVGATEKIMQYCRNVLRI